MQSSAAVGIRCAQATGAIAVAASGLRTVSRKNSTSATSSPQALAASSPSPARAVGSDVEKVSRKDGKLNYRVRKRRHPQIDAVISKAAEDLSDGSSTLLSSADPKLVLEKISGTVLTSSVTLDSNAGVRQSARLKELAVVRTYEKTHRASDAAQQPRSRSKNSPRVSKKSAGNAFPTQPLLDKGSETDLSAIIEKPPTDFWHSSLSDKSGPAIVKVLVEDALLPALLPSRSLSMPEDIAVALEHLKSVDPLLKDIIEAHDQPKFEKSTSAFTSLGRSIVFQQLSTKSASAIFQRLVVLCEGLDNFTPSILSQLSVQQLRTIGISGRKAEYLHDLAANFLSGALSDSAITTMDDEALMTALTAVKGIGMWSVHMFMLFSLHRPDVLPVSDLGVRKGFQKLYKLKELPGPAQLEQLASIWQPYRSLGSWYMWRVMSNTPIINSSSS